jgi:hypothetical protein
MAVITGTVAADSTFGSAVTDTIFGLAGDDTLDGLAGDSIYGGLGEITRCRHPRPPRRQQLLSRASRPSSPDDGILRPRDCMIGRRSP